MVELWTLRVFIEVGRQGSLSRAGEVLSMSQPAVSRQISGLERRLGVALFRRVPRGVLLTPAGEAALDLAQDVCDRLRQFEARLSAFTGLDGGRLRLAAFASVNSGLVPAAVHRFSTAYPEVEINLVQIDEDAQLSALRNGGVDMVLRTSWDTRDDRHMTIRQAVISGAYDPFDGIDVLPLTEEDLRVALPVGHRLAGADVVNLKELADEAWIEGAHPDCLGPIPQLAEAMGCEPRVAMHCDDWYGKLALVAAGGGVMLVPTSAGTTVRSDIALVETFPVLPRRKVLAMTAEPPFRPPTVTAMLRIMKDVIREHSQPMRVPQTA
ncbi:LysR family transcriptional regulator [Micromonospora sp. PLK6-60]|uniref:LysR family transcriptional regulator n=1 Tax=Micromonospora sp. PLK6-60 TaxID=2873383 RepID=UPI001CA61101|nr:LysR family transcriptional regulator [Micromonospora sp. PLK6-60]MBY8872032.1 LysR family transcriptional regulator [Micromonospora sp. PLK6-60]